MTEERTVKELDFIEQMAVIDSVLDDKFKRSNLPRIGQETRVLAQIVTLLRSALVMPNTDTKE
jgi:hypothetical protein